MEQQLLLGKKKGKRSSNKNNSLAVTLKGRERVLPIDEVIEHIDSLVVYNDERERSNSYRLHFNVNTIASNVCYNLISEITINEGSKDAESLNFYDEDKTFSLDEIDGTDVVQFQSGVAYHLRDLIKDTRFSASSSLTYHCGLDIFNNHIFRTDSFKTIGKPPKSGLPTGFNTLRDVMRDGEGKNIKTWNYTDISEEVVSGHAFMLEDVKSFKESVADNLKEKNGWIGFVNKAKFPMYESENNTYYAMNYNKVINKGNGNDFIDMYPEKDLFSFVPKYNNYRKRIEKNWNYCLTYPSSSITKGISFINQNVNSLKIFCFDDSYNMSNGRVGIKFWSASYHGLKKGDYINVYLDDNLTLTDCKVEYIIDDYTFITEKNRMSLSDKWVYFTEIKGKTYDFPIGNGKTITYTLSVNGNYFTSNIEGDENHYYITPSKKVYFDETVCNVSFKKLVGGNECKYYVRIFSRIPNWKYASEEPTYYNLYKKGSTLISDNQTIANEFENQIGQNGFAKNIYNDDIASIVFNDDIDISNLRDNLGRPLHEIYLTVVKNNAGYRTWYGKNMGECNSKSSDIEYSHCFGKVSCAFELSLYSQQNSSFNSSTLLTSDAVQDRERGFNTSRINKHCYLKDDKVEDNGLEVDEIEYNQLFDKEGYKIYDGDVNFYGDLCSYSEETQKEEVIQEIDYRFNTVQRELNNAKYTATKYFDKIFYDEMENDDYDVSSFSVVEKYLPYAQHKEGYRYHPHFRVGLKTVSDTLKTEHSTIYPISRIENLNDTIGDIEYVIRTTVPHGFSPNQRLGLFHTTKRQNYDCTIKHVIDFYTIRVSITDKNGADVYDIYTNDAQKLRLYYRNEEKIPDYATFLTDGSCRYVWREILQNTIINNDGEVYPFTNGALYIDKTIELFVKRQNPNMAVTEFPYDFDPQEIEADKTIDKYFEENDIEC